MFFGSTLKSPETQITLNTSDLTKSFSTSAKTVGDFLREVGIQPSEGDLVKPPIKTPVTPGIVVYYRKSVKVFLADAGKPEKVVSGAGDTVCDLLDAANVVLGPQDIISPSTDTPLQSGMHISITRKDSVDIIEERPIPPPVTYEADPDLDRGETQNSESGRDGVEEATTRIYYLNNEEKCRVQVKDQVVVEPIPQVTRVGTHPSLELPSRAFGNRSAAGRRIGHGNGGHRLRSVAGILLAVSQRRNRRR